MRSADPGEFSALTEPYRRELRAHCYRMLGSLHEAEELVQETLLRAWRRRETYEGRAPLRAWLYKIATNLCLDSLERRPRRTLPVARQAVATLEDPIPADITEPIWLEAFPDDFLGPDAENPEARYSRRESVTLAFLVALQLLPPRQRAVVLLRDVLEWPASEVAELLGLTVPAVKSALHRARTTLSENYEAEPAEQLDRATLDGSLNVLLEQYVQAWESADIDGLTSLLKADATFSMPPIPAWYRGKEDIRALIGRTIFSGRPARRWRLARTRANGQLGFGLYRWAEAEAVFRSYGIQVVTLAGQAVADITTIRNPPLVAFFNLPASLTAAD